MSSCQTPAASFAAEQSGQTMLGDVCQCVGNRSEMMVGTFFKDDDFEYMMLSALGSTYH